MLTIIKKFDDVMESFGFRKNKRRSDIARAHGLGQDWYDNDSRGRKGGGVYHQKENPSLPGTLERIDQQIYDSGDIVSASTTSLEYFTTPVGQGSTAKTLINTNMRQAGLLPSPEKFIINRIGLYVSSAVVADVFAIQSKVLWTFFVNAKRYQIGPVFYYPSGFGISGFSTATAVTGVTNGFPGELGVRSLLEPIPLEPLDPFNGNLTMYGGASDIIGTLTLTATTRVWAVLQGPYQRAI